MKEKANKTSAVPRPVKKVKGTVLFTVVCVMMVLVVFLMGTLTLAATANKRALTNYQQEQTEYTAKAVLDAVLAKANDTTDTALKDAIAGIHTSGTALDLDVTIPGDTAQETSHVTITDTGRTQWLYSTADAAWREIPIYNMSVTVRSQTTAASTTYNAVLAAAAAVNPTTTTQTNPPALGSGGGGAFVAIGKLNGALGTGGYVSGGTYIGLENKDNGEDPLSVNYSVGGDQEPQFDAPTYIYGNFTAEKVMQIHFTRPDEYFAVMGDFKHDNSGLETEYSGWTWNSKYDYGSIPKIYVGGTMYITGKLFIGNNAVPTNIFANTLEWNSDVSDTGIGIHGDIYMFDPNGTSHLNAYGNQATELYNWVSSTITPTNTNGVEGFGNVLSAGSVEITGYGDNADTAFDIPGSLRIEKDCTTNKRVTVGSASNKGDVVVAGTLTNNGYLTVYGDLIAGGVVNNGTIEIKNGGSIKVVKNGSGAPNWSGANPNGATATAVTANVKSTGASTEVRNYYQIGSCNVNKDGNQWKMEVQHTVYTSIDGGAWTSKTIQGHEAGGKIMLPETAGNNSEEVKTWAAANEPTYKDMLTYNSETNCKITTITSGYYDLSGVYGKAVYPAKYVKGVMMDVTDPTDPTKTIQVDQMPYNVFTEPSASSYTGSYISNTTQLETYGYYQLSGPLKDTNGNTIEANYEGYKVPVYKIGSDAMTNKYNEDQFGGSLSAIDKTNYYEINSSCVLSGTFDKPVYINGASFVILDNCTVPGTLVVNDDSQTTLYVAGSFSAQSVITKNYIEHVTGGFDPSQGYGTNFDGGKMYSYNLFAKNQATLTEIEIPQLLTASDWRYPNVMIYAQNSSTVNITGERSLVTAIIRAPYCDWTQSGASNCGLTVQYEPTNGDKIAYGSGFDCNSPLGRNFENKNIGLIGELIANDITLNVNERWGLLYVTDGTHSTTPPPISSTFVPGSTQQTVVTSGGSAEYFSFMYYNLS